MQSDQLNGVSSSRAAARGGRYAFEALAAQIDRIVNPPGDNVVALGGTG